MPRKTGDLFALSGHVALITGAGAGFGEALAVGFAEYGCDVAAVDVNLVRLRERFLASCQQQVGVRLTYTDTSECRDSPRKRRRRLRPG
jgi:NAD(P)-dependent dehydrogenase (short-subunit alcohol dehydrogenase family)